MANPNNLTGIGHPGNPTWQLPAFDEAESLIRLQLEPRFANTTEDIEMLVDTVLLLTMRSESHRDSHEKGNSRSLGLSGADRNKYEELAGNPAYIGEAVYWLGHVAHTALNRPIDLVLGSGIGLELGGNLQFGDWETTGPLDRMARDIPVQLDAIDKAVRMKIYGERRDEGKYDELAIAIEYDENARKNYRLWPRHREESAKGQAFRHALLRRRRAVADIYIPGIRPIEIYKDADMVIVPQEMEDEERHCLYEAHNAFKGKRGNNTPDALIAGAAVERAITSAKGSTKDVIPIGAHYVMKMFRDGRSLAKSLEA